MYCSGCDYDLRGLTEHRCPECGRPFLPDDPTTFRKLPSTVPDPEHDWEFLRGGITAWVLLLVAIFSPFLNEPSLSALSAAAFVLGTFVAGRVLVRGVREVLQGRSHGWMFTVGVIAALLAAILAACMIAIVGLFFSVPIRSPLIPFL